jgi:hypothetical protein
MASFLNNFLQSIKKYPVLVLGIIGITIGITILLIFRNKPPERIPIKISQNIPNPKEAEQQAPQLTPEQLTSIEIDEKIRDRLRFDPRWQPILLEVRKDIDTLKWTNTTVEGLENPIWKRYGAKVYPLLDYYTRFGDRLRQEYGIAGIRSLGKPYTTLWLTKQLQLNRILLSNRQGGNFSEKESAFLDFYPSKELLEKEFGLDDSKIRQKLINIAKDNLKPKTYIYYDAQLNDTFLIEFLGDDYDQKLADSSFDPNSEPALKHWDRYERLNSLDKSQIQEIVSYYHSLSKNAQEYILADRLGEIKAGEISLAGKALFQNLANDRTSPYRMWSIAELDPTFRRLKQGQGSFLVRINKFELFVNKDKSG